LWVALRRPRARHPAWFKLTSRTLKDARKQAGDALADPAAFFAARAATEDETPDTFGTLAEQFLDHGRTKRGRVPRLATKREYRRALVYARSLHAKPVRDVRCGEIAELIRTTARKGGVVTAMRTRAALSRFFSWLLANDRVDSNPVVGTEGYDVPKRERVLSDAELRPV
jgi:site-specific recombinase XerC